jgi:hypothetical protein
MVFTIIIQTRPVKSGRRFVSGPQNDAKQRIERFEKRVLLLNVETLTLTCLFQLEIVWKEQAIIEII